VKRRDLTADELALWRRAMRNTMPLPGRTQEIAVEPAGTPAAAAGNAQRPPARSAPQSAPQPSATDKTQPAGTASAPPPTAAPPSGVDAATNRRLRRGRLTVEARCDLHGMRQFEAHGALNRFIAESQAAGRRCVLVITGKGGRIADTGDAPFMQRQEDGVLRRQVPHWLRQEPNASLVFAIEPAHARHGGSGALYVFLRKSRKAAPS